jgi:hypothetical protein
MWRSGGGKVMNDLNKIKHPSLIAGVTVLILGCTAIRGSCATRGLRV